MRRALPLLLLCLTTSCVLFDRPLLGLRSVAGGIHNRRQVSGIHPFFLPDGRMGIAANGALLIERERGGALVRMADVFSEIDDPAASPDGERVAFVSGKEQITAGGGHNDHVFQLYDLELATGRWRRLSESRRAEVLPRYTADGEELVFVRRAEYDGWSLENPWGGGSLFLANADGTDERRLTEPLGHPVLGLTLVADDTLLLYAAVPETGPHAGVPCLYALDFSAVEGAPDEYGEQRPLVRGAYRPAAVPGTDTFVAALERADGASLGRFDREGNLLEERPLGVSEVLGLAVPPDGRRVVFSDFDPDGGRFGVYRLWHILEGDDRPILLETVEYRISKRYKPLDVIKPPSWWFRSGKSPGSR